ncbi:MAG: copper transporter [Sporichthyaceae bacterium]
MSLVAVFMALATGILVGSSLINQSLIDSQRSDISALRGEKDSLRQSLDAAQGEVAYRDSYLTELRETLLPGRLLGHRVSLVVMPGANGKDVDALARTLTESGAQISGRIALSDDFFAESGDADLAAKAKLRDETVRRHALPSVRSKAPAAQLAAALLTKDAGRTLDADAEGLLTELDRAGFLSRAAVAAPGDLAILITGATPPKATPQTDRRRSGSVDLAAAMDAASNGAVVVGPTQDTNGSVQSVRKEASVASVVSTVDSVDTPFGQIATVYALVEQIAGGAGQYGSADAGDAPLPRFRASTTRR